MTQTSEPADVAAILEALRAEVRAQRATQGSGEVGTALGAIERELHHAAEQLEITRVVSAHWPLEGRTLYERGWVLINKVVRRGLRWYIGPIVEQQNGFNEAAARALRLLIEAHTELREQAAELRRALEAEQGDGGRGEQGDARTGGQGDRGTGGLGEGGTSVVDALLLQGEAEPASHPEAVAALPAPALQQIAAPLQERSLVQAHWELAGATALERARAFVQRVQRQYLRWLINPIVEQQNAYNQALAAGVPQLIAADRELRARIEALRARQQAHAKRQSGAR